MRGCGFAPESSDSLATPRVGRDAHDETIRLTEDGPLVEVFVTMSAIQGAKRRTLGATAIAREAVRRIEEMIADVKRVQPGRTGRTRPPYVPEMPGLDRGNGAGRSESSLTTVPGGSCRVDSW